MTNKGYEEDLIFWLDWSTRHLKNYQKQCPPRLEHLFDSMHMFSVMKVTCDILDINVMEWCKATKIPYKKRESSYENLFTATEPYEILGKPMLKQGYFNELIYKMIGTNPKLEPNL